MKKLQLLFAMMVIGMASATASEFVSETKAISLEKQGEDLTITKRYRNTQPIVFVERGVEFLIFPDGSFDFNTDYDNWSDDDYYYRGKHSRRGTINRAYNAPGTKIGYTSRHTSRNKRGMRVIRDRWGNIRRVGNVFINYDLQGRVKRVGSVYMRYHRQKLVQVGNLRLIYGKRGRLINMKGKVNYRNDGNYFRKNGKQDMYKKNNKNKRKKFDN